MLHIFLVVRYCYISLVIDRRAYDYIIALVFERDLAVMAGGTVVGAVIFWAFTPTKVY